jgi:hypothetical protein
MMTQPQMMAAFLPKRSEMKGATGREATLPMEYIAVRRPSEEPVGESNVFCQLGMIWSELNMALNFGQPLSGTRKVISLELGKVSSHPS